MIEYFNGDIFTAPIDIIIQNCNCFNTQSAGFAKIITKRYPRVLASDLMTERGAKSKLGQFSISLAAEDQFHHVISLYGQYYYGGNKDNMDYLKFSEGLENIKSWIRKMGMENLTIGMCYGIGAGLSGGSWDKIFKIIKYHFEKDDLKLLICKKE